MTNADQSLADDKMRAEIAKMLAETKQIGVMTFVTPFATAGAFVAAIATLTKLFL